MSRNPRPTECQSREFQNHRSLRCYKVRLQHVPRGVSPEIFFEKLIACFQRHERNLYDRPEFVLCGLSTYGDSIELLVRTETKAALLARLDRLKIPCRNLRCRPFDPAGMPSGGDFSGWLVNHYGLDSSDPGRRKIRLGQRRPIGNNHTLHICSRSVQQRLLFGHAEKEMMVQVFELVARKLPFQLHSFVVLDNHFHLVVTTKQDVSISDLMHRIRGQISRRFNQRHGTRGTLWQGRFRCIVWEATFKNLLYLIDYVHANPLRAGLVSDAGQYRWSSFAHYVGLQRRRMLVVPLCIRRHRPHRIAREAWYRSHFLERFQAGTLAYNQTLGRGMAHGSKDFVRKIVNELADPLRIPAFVKGALRRRRHGQIWGLKTLLHLLCQPAVQAWRAVEPIPDGVGMASIPISP